MISAASKGKKKIGAMQERGGRRGFKTPSEMLPTFTQGGNRDRPPARDEISKIKNSAGAAVSSGNQKKSENFVFFFKKG